MPLPTPVGRQHDVAYLNPHGHIVVLGTAGTGKTVMAVHRAVHLATPTAINHGRTLLLTYTNSLVTYLRHLTDLHVANLTVETYGSFGRGYLASIGRMGFNQIADPDLRRHDVERAVKTVSTGYKAGDQFFRRPTEFFLDELEWIDGNGLAALSDYLKAARVGRMEALQPAAREAVWKIRDEYTALRTAGGKPYDWPGIPGAVRQGLLGDARPRRYKHIVVDEAQDLSPEAIRSLAAAIPLDGSLTLFADYAQQIYGQRISWRSCGLTVVKQEVFKDNYRNSPEIARLAIAMANLSHFKDSADIVEPVVPTRASGAKPTVVQCESTAAEAALTASTAAELGRSARVAILCRTRAESRLASDGIAGRRMLHDRMNNWDISNGVYAGTYHSAKGLEFDAVLLPFCGADRQPDPDTIAAFGLEEASSRESRLLYVGVTRAKTDLIITHTGDLTSLLPPTGSDLYTVTT